MPDQADHLRQLVRDAVAVRGDLAPGAPIIAISAAAAGLGATALAAALARELARLGQRVVLVDAHLDRPALAEALQAPARRHPCALPDILDGSRRAVEALIPCADGVQLLPGGRAHALTPLDNLAFERFHSELSAASRQADLIVIDAGHGMSPWIDRLWNLASHVLLATTPTDDHVLAAYAALKHSHYGVLDGKLRLVLNRAASDAVAAGAAARFASACRRFLGVAVQRHATLPACTHQEFASTEPDAPFRRGARQLAADLISQLPVVSCQLPAKAIPHVATEHEQLTTDAATARD